MNGDRSSDYYLGLVQELAKLSKETEWVEFKKNLSDNREIGEYISALSNSAALLGKPYAYLAWGIEDETHEILGTEFDPFSSKQGNELLENWLTRLLSPRLDFRFRKIICEGSHVILLEIPCAFRHPVQFEGQEFIRIGSYKKKLKEHPEKERALWRVFDETPFEQRISMNEVSEDRLLSLIDYTVYFDLINQPLPRNRDGILRILESEHLISRSESGLWNILNLGAVLFAKKISDFEGLGRKAALTLRKSKWAIEDTLQALRD